MLIYHNKYRYKFDFLVYARETKSIRITNERKLKEIKQDPGRGARTIRIATIYMSLHAKTDTIKKTRSARGNLGLDNLDDAGLGKRAKVTELVGLACNDLAHNTTHDLA